MTRKKKNKKINKIEIMSQHLYTIHVHDIKQRLCKLSAITEHDNARLKMYDLAVKYTLLGVLTASISFITLVCVGLLRMDCLSAVDGIVASVCLTLMSKSYDSCYRRTCCCCLYMVFGRDFKSIEDIISNDPGKHLRRLGTATAALSTSGMSPRSQKSTSFKGHRSESRTKSGVEEVQDIDTQTG
ncbi:hypothetical protein RFI_15409 [Reticulomyxa filosa]|uniref:Uncharacterized protein n=1 Tax=Reticulomyxa filosa TaxID=46433 RepID=X6N7A2_RETFI|nr:hypothetical protein RFI_15409 [Reticulomyxa filosa]|eukprot:ETO21793.1 hypothetical protein RFI_15409 [Reticulomyxa filosa]